MGNSEKIRDLKKLLKKSSTVTVESSDDTNFQAWRNLVERVFIKIFGKESIEFAQFDSLNFYYPAMVFTEDSDYTSDHLKYFRQDFKMLKHSINEYIEEFEEQKPHENLVGVTTSSNQVSKIFISHASKDADIVEELIDILESLGVESGQIFCSSFEGYGIELGNDFLESLKSELKAEALVLFVLSKNFYESPICLCEMGASWVLSNHHIPILIPPMEYSDVKGVIPLSQGLKINEPRKLNLLKEKIEKLFEIENRSSQSTWERRRDRAIARIEKSISDQAAEDSRLSFSSVRRG